MSEHKTRDSTSLDPEIFQAREAATGKTTPYREMTDEQLAKCILDANTQSKQMMIQGIQMIGQSMAAGKAASCMEYELDRRRRSIALVTDLNQIQELSKQ